MSTRIDTLRRQLRDARTALLDEIETRRDSMRYALRGRRIEFDDEIRSAHRAARESLVSLLSRTRFLVFITAPLIYALILPLVLLDLFVSVFHAVCFPVYGIPKVARHDHIAIDRHHLQYLNILQQGYSL